MGCLRVLNRSNNRALRHQKRDPELEPTIKSLWINFGSQKEAQIRDSFLNFRDETKLAKLAKIARGGTKIAQDGPKMTKIAPRWFQDGPRWSQDGPTMGQDGARWSEMAPRSPEDIPRRPKVAAKSSQDWPRWPKINPTWPEIQTL